MQALKNISTLARPALALWVHLGLSASDYPADIGPALLPNSGPEAVAELRRLGASPQGLPGRRVVMVPPGQPVETLKQRQREYPGAEIRVIRLGQRDLFPGYLRVLLGVEDNPAGYLRWLDQAAAELGDKASPEALLKAIADNKELDKLARARASAAVKRAAAFIVPAGQEQTSLWADLDGAHVIADMRSDKLSSRDALGVVMTLLGSMSLRRDESGDFLPGVVVLDEFNKLVAQGKISPVALSQFTEVRHRLLTVLISGQLPSQFPAEVANLATGVVVGQIEGAESYEAVCKMKPSMRKVSRETLAKLKKGEVYLHFRDASDEAFRGEPVKVKIRAACAQPGGQTRSSNREEEGED